MKIQKAVWLSAIVAAILWSVPAFAGHMGGFGGGHHGGGLHMGTVRGNSGGAKSATSTDTETGETGESLSGPRSNKGGELRGLNRANAVAGEHGEQGRSNAASTFGHTKTK